jgi:4-hydroxybenzoate polyprenyltransferase
MNQLKIFLSLLRPKQVAKQALVLLPIMSIGSEISWLNALETIKAVVAFIFASGFVYVVNDLNDFKSDQKDPTKLNRPYAAGKVSAKLMKVFGFIFIFSSLVLCVSADKNAFYLFFIIFFYVSINILYSVYKLKQHRILGLAIVGVGFPLRFIFGSLALGLPLSPWGFTLLFQLSIFMLSGKRFQTTKRHIIIHKMAEKVNGELDFWILALVSLGSLFTSSYVGFITQTQNQAMWGTAPLLFSTIPLGLGILRYLEIVTHAEKYKSGDATEDVIRDRILIILMLTYCLIMIYGRSVYA